MPSRNVDLLAISEGLVTVLNHIPALKSLAWCVHLAALSRDLPEEVTHISQLGNEMLMLIDLIEDELDGTLRKVKL